MFLTAASLLVKTQTVQCSAGGQSQRIECGGVHQFYLLADFFKTDTADPADGVGEIPVNYFFIDTNGFKDLGSQV